MNHKLSFFGRRDFLRLGGAGAFGATLRGRVPAVPRSCIVLWQSGGCSHLDTFDMKPSAPGEIRGEFRPIRTSAPGIEICEHLPRTASLAHRFSIVRSMCSDETNHERARHHLETAMAYSPEKTWPRLSEIAVASTVRGNLGTQCADAVRAVEAGAKFVFVRHEGYDTHAANFERLRQRILPEFDTAFSSLLLNLDGRGLLETTLVVVTGEFGRSPRINAKVGRDHHAGAWSVLLAGAGVPGGRVIGATDETGSQVVESPVSPADLLRTIAEILFQSWPEQYARAALFTTGRAISGLLA